MALMNRKQRRAAKSARPIGAAPVPSAIQQTRIALAHSARGDHTAAMRAIVVALAMEENAHSRAAFVECVRAMQFFEDNAAIRGLVLRALRENWGRPEDLALPAADLIKAAGTGIAALAHDDLLRALLCVTPNQDGALEDALMVARGALLRAPGQVPLEFLCALAQQCFLNEYVFTFPSEEQLLVARLEQETATALDHDAVIAPSQIAALALYRPLTDRRLLDRQWPADIDALLTQQLREPAEERQLAAALPQLTPVTDPVSCRVAQQYEENPYPRWMAAGLPATGTRERAIADILVAGCGTGRNAIETAQAFGSARVLAVDLSRASLGHAARKARQLAVANIAYAQADLLKIGALDRRFDLIEAVGVLHHLADPFFGWRVLLGLLKPGGVMKIGLYSAMARRDVAAARAELAAQGFAGTPHGLRAARRYLRARPKFTGVTQRSDFFTLSGCRDLLFHVQESHVSLTEIATFLSEHGLAMLGFDLDAPVLADYQTRFPGDPAAIDLDNWTIFEAEHPATFRGMYQFWVQQV
ncbi:MAG: hypothetical protein BGN85_01275 [Alphaproteobacteria bacterium 64-11]|nr:MAG: hypothetical protein BGN85_01275 [Alphaproteobacteria bacterium 64-11]